MEQLTPPDIEAAVVEILSVPDGPWVSTKYPPDERHEVNGVIRISSTGGGRPIDLVVIAPTVLIECWHSDDDTAHRTAQWAWSRLMTSAGTVVNGVSINRVNSTLLNNNPDVNRRRMVRYQFVAEVWTRLEPITKETP